MRDPRADPRVTRYHPRATVHTEGRRGFQKLPGTQPRVAYWGRSTLLWVRLPTTARPTSLSIPIRRSRDRVCYGSEGTEPSHLWPRSIIPTAAARLDFLRRVFLRSLPWVKASRCISQRTRRSSGLRKTTCSISVSLIPLAGITGVRERTPTSSARA
jgi:hypothetical protein